MRLLSKYRETSTRRSSKWLFYCLSTTVLRALLSTLVVVARKESNSRYVARLGGSSRTIRSAGLICKPRGSQEHADAA